VVVRFQGPEVVDRAAATGIKHVERVDDKKPNLFAFGQIAILVDKVVPGMSFVILALKDKDVFQHLFSEVFFTQPGDITADLDEA